MDFAYGDFSSAGAVNILRVVHSLVYDANRRADAGSASDDGLLRIPIVREPKMSILAELRRRIREFADLGKGWDGYGADPAAPISVDNADSFLATAVATYRAPNRILPSASGGVVASFQRDGRKATVEFLNTGDVIALYAGNRMKPKAVRVTSTKDGYEELLQRIAEYLDEQVAGAPAGHVGRWATAGPGVRPG